MSHPTRKAAADRRRRGWLQACLVLAMTALAAPVAAGSTPAAPATLKWETLVPEGWDPMQALQGENLDLLNDGDPRAMAMMSRLRKAWDDAPVRQDLDGRAVRLPGYVVPLQQADGKVAEFLLVPYFGACIHTPPPPANQIVHVALDKPRPLRSMQAVWASGTLRVRRTDGGMGSSGYALEEVSVVPYKADKR